ncbi:MAG: amino acid racemase [Gemmatimonadota bacterium]|nr:MAG: amino acid racemase [Gemmatimonadota bacterium]
MSGTRDNSRPTIGLLAGMGVRSTAPFLDLVIAECQRQYGAREEMDYPHMIVFSWPTPFFFDRPIDPDALRESIARGLALLEGTGVDFMAMPCNSAHAYFDELAAGVGVRLLSMIDATCAAVPENVNRMALLATRTTRDAGFYHRALGVRGIDLVVDESIQLRVDSVLEEVRRVSDMTAPRRRWEELLQDLADGGMDAGLIACTDLNVVLGGHEPLPLVDGTRSLARLVVRTWLEMRDGAEG